MKQRSERPQSAGRNFKKSLARDVAYIALGVALVTVCAWMTVPVAAIPVTMQTFAVALIGALLGWKRALAAVFTYVFAGLIGIPVFSGFRAGVGALFGATGGYVFGFLFAALLPGLAKLLPVKNKWGRAGVFYVAAVLGLVVCYLFGTLWFAYLTRCGIGYALTVCVLPYLLPDAVKLAIAALLAVRLEKYVKI